jgi:hypothetical protein
VVSAARTRHAKMVAIARGIPAILPRAPELLLNVKKSQP